MRLTHLNSVDVQKAYASTLQSVQAFEPRKQSSWYFQASGLLRLARVAYALGHPLTESREWLRKATVAYRELFALRGTSFSTVTRYKNGQPLPAERVASDGYTSVQSFEAALAALVLGEVALARELVELAGHSPGHKLVSPSSEVCNANEQALSHALNALLAADHELAQHEASKLAARRGTKIEKQIALLIAAIATQGDVLTERDALLFHHAAEASRRNNQLNTSLWLCLPALGLSQLAIRTGRYTPGDLATDSVYCPLAMLNA